MVLLAMMTGVFEGGGIKGIALAGAAAAAIEEGIQFSRVVGTSAGALVGSLVAAGYGPDELEQAVRMTDWRSLLRPRSFGRLPGLGPHLAMVLGRGVSSGQRMERTWARLLSQKGIRSFADLAPGTLRVVATDVTHGRGIVLPDNLEDFGIDPQSYPVARAVRASSTVPFLFRPVTLTDSLTAETSYLVDGAFAARFPIQLVQPDEPTIGFRLLSRPEPHTHHKINGPIGLAAAVISSGMTAREALPVLCRNTSLVIEIAIDHDSLNFEITRDEAATMFQLGKDQARQQLSGLLPSR